MATDGISPGMQEVIRGPKRTLVWLFWFENGGGDLYAWSGAHKITWDEQEYAGVGHVSKMSTVRKADGVQHTTQQFTMSGLDPTPLGDIDQSVRGLGAKVWLGALNDAGQIIPSPFLVSELVQDTLNFEAGEDGTVSLTLEAFEALPFLGRATNEFYSHESQLKAYPGDTGLKYTQEIEIEGEAPYWVAG